MHGNFFCISGLWFSKIRLEIKWARGLALQMLVSGHSLLFISALGGNSMLPGSLQRLVSLILVCFALSHLWIKHAHAPNR